MDIPQAESAEDTEDVQTDVDFSSDEEVPAAGDTSKRELTEAELKQIAEAKNAYDRLTETEEKKFRSENTALVENMEKLLAMALTYEKGQSAYQQFFADEAAQIYATVNITFCFLQRSCICNLGFLLVIKRIIQCSCIYHISLPVIPDFLCRNIVILLCQSQRSVRKST